MNRLLSLVVIVGAIVLLAAMPARAQEPTAEDYIKFHEPLLGTWKATVEEGGKVHVGTARWQLAAGKKCLMVSLAVRGLPGLQAIIGFDPATKKCVQTSFDSDGTFQLSTLDIANMKPGKAMAKGMIGKWEEKRFSTDGITATATETLSCTEFNKDRMTFVWSDRKEGDKLLPDWKLTYERPAAVDGVEDFQEYVETMVGEYEGEFVLAGDVPGVGKDGDKVKGRAVIAAACDKKGMEGQYEFGSARGKWITVWDPQLRRIKENGFESTGAAYEARITKEQGKWVFRGTTVYPDGMKRTVTDTLTVEDGGKTHIHVGVVFLNGKKQPGYRDVWKRMK